MWTRAEYYCGDGHKVYRCKDEAINILSTTYHLPHIWNFRDTPTGSCTNQKSQDCAHHDLYNPIHIHHPLHFPQEIPHHQYMNKIYTKTQIRQNTNPHRQLSCRFHHPLYQTPPSHTLQSDSYTQIPAYPIEIHLYLKDKQSQRKHDREKQQNNSPHNLSYIRPQPTFSFIILQIEP